MNVDQIVKNSITDKLALYGWNFANCLIFTGAILVVFAAIPQISIWFMVLSSTLFAFWIVIANQLRKQKNIIKGGTEITPIQYYTLRQIFESSKNDDVSALIERYLNDGVITQGEYDLIIRDFFRLSTETDKVQKGRILKSVNRKIGAKI